MLSQKDTQNIDLDGNATEKGYLTCNVSTAGNDESYQKTQTEGSICWSFLGEAALERERERWGCETALMSLRTAGSFCEVMIENNKERWGWQWRWDPGWECKPIRGGRKRLASPREGGERERRREASLLVVLLPAIRVSWGGGDSSTIRRFGSVVDEWVCFPSMVTRVVEVDGSTLSV